jgi:hypothetical protein
MTKRSIFSIFLLLGVIGAYCYWNDFFRKPTIQITPSIRPGLKSRLNPDAYPVAFMLDGKYQLTMLKVITVADAKTNKYPRPIWHMISDSSSQPTKIINYGERIRGMKPSVPKGRPEPLQPNIPYRLMIEAGERKGQVDFLTKEVVDISPQSNN